jgi:5'-nucleotidase
MHFLLTNDDGIAAPGLWAAARTLASLGSVLVVAPASNYSGYGPAHPPEQSIAYERYFGKGCDLPNVTAYALAATPAACAHIGLSGAFGQQRIDMVVSGINKGANLGHDVLYSGTVGAALTAQLLGYAAVAASLDYSGSGVAHWESAGWAICRAIEMWRKRIEPAPLVFNVNVPNLAVQALSGVQLTTFGTNSFLGKYQFRSDPNDEHALVALRADDECLRAGNVLDVWSDSAAVECGRVSITPLRPFPDLLCVAPWIETEECVDDLSTFESVLTR